MRLKDLKLLAPGLNRGFFIAIEGLDGAGKSTIKELLTQALINEGFEPKTIKEPTEGPFGQKIRCLALGGRKNISPEEELNYFIADRAEDVELNIAPALLAGRPVIADRYILSNVAYQSVLGLDENKILALNKDFPWPDLTIILEISVKTGLERISSGRSGGLDIAFERPDYLNKVKEVYDRQNFPGLIRLDGQKRPEENIPLILAHLKKLAFIPRQDLKIIDSHCHLCCNDFKDDIESVLSRAKASGVSDIINIGLGLENCAQVLKLADKHPWCRPALGWHPHDAANFSDKALDELINMALDSRVLAFGEIGLDYALMRSAKEKQLEVFDKLLNASLKIKKPLIIHCREAFNDCFNLLKKYASKLKTPGLIHCFTKDWQEAKAYLDLGFYLSIPGVITFPKNEYLKETVAKIPLDRLLIETDAPYLAPHPFRGKRNEPSYLIYHLQTIAEARNSTLAEIAQISTANARRLFNF